MLMTDRYEYYFDCVLKGQYIWEIERMHMKYGPIIRINPHEVHCSDPAFFHEIYTQTKKRDVWSWAKKGFGIDVSTLTTVNHDLHKKRRAALNPLFSKQRIVRLQPVIQERLDFFLGRIQEAGQAGKELNFKLGVAAFTAGMLVFKAYLVCVLMTCRCRHGVFLWPIPKQACCRRLRRCIPRRHQFRLQQHAFP